MFCVRAGRGPRILRSKERSARRRHLCGLEELRKTLASAAAWRHYALLIVPLPSATLRQDYRLRRRSVSRTFLHDGICFHYDVSGDGAPLVFCHGLGADLSQPDAAFELVDGVREYRFEGFGVTMQELE